MAEFPFRRQSQYRFAALTADGTEVRGTLKALDHESVRDALEQKGLNVYDLKQVEAPEDLEQRCEACDRVNNWEAMVCANCGAPLRGSHVSAADDVELAKLAEDLVVRENSDGSVTVTKSGRLRWRRARHCLVFVGVALQFYDIRNEPAFRFAGALIGLPAIGALLGCTLWALFVRDEWHVDHGFCEQRRSLFGIDRGHTFRVGVIRLEVRPDRMERYRVSVLDTETSRVVCEALSETTARTMAVLLAQRTAWVLDDQIPH